MMEKDGIYMPFLSLTILMICEVWQPDGRQSEINIIIIWPHFSFLVKRKICKKKNKKK